LPGAVDAQLAVVRECNYVTVEVEMMRDGPEETIVTSVVEPIEVGQDGAGKTLTSLVVKPGETPAEGHMSTRWTGSLAKFQKALSEALLNSDIKITVGGRSIHAADREDVRKEFYRICMVDGDSVEEKQDTRKKRFARAAERAQDCHLIGVRVEPSGRELIWLLRQAQSRNPLRRAMSRRTSYCRDRRDKGYTLVPSRPGKSRTGRDIDGTFPAMSRANLHTRASRNR
jgi:hypothetical protein